MKTNDKHKWERYLSFCKETNLSPARFKTLLKFKKLEL